MVSLKRKVTLFQYEPLLQVETAYVGWSAKSLFGGMGAPRGARVPAAPSPVETASLTAASTLEILLAESAERVRSQPAPPVTATLPSAPAPAVAVAADTKNEAGEDLGPRVLLAEDHPVNRKVVELILGAVGARITWVENGALAVEAFQRDTFDVVLMDMQMPVMDGLTAIRRIREWERETGAARTPILSLTANAMPEHVEASHAAGADDHLTKPVSAPGLIAAVQSAAAGREIEPQPLRRRA